MKSLSLMACTSLLILTSSAFADSVAYDCQAKVRSAQNADVTKRIEFTDADVVQGFAQKEIVQANGFSYSLIYTNFAKTSPQLENASGPMLNLIKKDAQGTVKLSIYAAEGVYLVDTEESQSLSDGKSVTILCNVSK